MLLQERDLAASATGEEARAVHAKMSALYAALLTLSYVDEANSSVSENRQHQTMYLRRPHKVLTIHLAPGR
jgi:hypothetical protein